MHEDDEKIKIGYEGLVADENVNIKLPDSHVCCHFGGDRKCPALPKMFQDTM